MCVVVSWSATYLSSVSREDSEQNLVLLGDNGYKWVVCIILHIIKSIACYFTGKQNKFMLGW